MAALRVGARGYMLKGATQEEVLAAIRAAAAGRAGFGPGVAGRVLGGRRGPSYDLTEGEADLLALLANGMSNAEIAREIGVSLKTVHNHVSRAPQGTR